MVNLMPGSTETTPPVGDVDDAPAAWRTLPVVAADACGPTAIPLCRIAVRRVTGGSFIHAATASLTRGAAQTAAITAKTQRMENAARRAARLWG
jgi:hypothetical protein